MSYEIATGASSNNQALGRRIASIAPAAGAPLSGFNAPPIAGGAVALLDIRGQLDNTCPANISNGWPAPWLGPGEPGPFNSSLSADGFFYTPVDNVTQIWASALGCPVGGLPQHYPTRFDGFEGFYCVAPHGLNCRRPSDGAQTTVVRCFHTVRKHSMRTVTLHGTTNASVPAACLYVSPLRRYGFHTTGACTDNPTF